MKSVERIALFSTEDENGTVEYVAIIGLFDDIETTYRKYENSHQVNIYNEHGREYDVFTDHALKNASMDEFYASCKEHAIEEADNLLYEKLEANI